VARDGERADRPLPERVAVGRGLGDRVDADGERAARPVVDDYRLAQLLRQGRRDDARDVVGGAAGRLRDDQADRPLRVLRGSRPRSPEQQNCCE
jgi:hypothetical protein